MCLKNIALRIGDIFFVILVAFLVFCLDGTLFCSMFFSGGEGVKYAFQAVMQ